MRAIMQFMRFVLGAGKAILASCLSLLLGSCMTANLGHSPKVLSPGQVDNSVGICSYTPLTQLSMPFGNLYYYCRSGLWHGVDADVRLMLGDAPMAGIRVDTDIELTTNPILLTAIIGAGFALAPGTQSNTLLTPLSGTRPVNYGVDLSGGIILGSSTYYGAVLLNYEAKFYDSSTESNVMPEVLFGAELGEDHFRVVPEVGVLFQPTSYFYFPAWTVYGTVALGLAFR